MALCGGDRQRLGACDIRHKARKPARKPIDLRSIRHAVWREIEITVDFDLYRLDSLVGPAVRPDDMPAGIGLIARDGHAKPVGQGHDLLAASFARAVAEAIPDDHSPPKTGRAACRGRAG